MESTEQPNAVATLEITDLVNIKEMLEICTQRGAFRAQELSTVGHTYDRLSAFLSAATQNSDAEPGADIVEEVEE